MGFFKKLFEDLTEENKTGPSGPREYYKSIGYQKEYTLDPSTKERIQWRMNDYEIAVRYSNPFTNETIVLIGLPEDVA